MPINPAMLLVVGVIGGTAAAATYTTFHYAEKASSQLTISDFRPAFPWEGLPLPIFFYTKPEVLDNLRRSK